MTRYCDDGTHFDEDDSQNEPVNQQVVESTGELSEPHSRTPHVDDKRMKNEQIS